ncbi:carboxy terminal-processing peptidase [Luteolibacter arcticus]|uniref:Carboxy terminal-processing peptidase n=1 Tax=Luteolibacter arcticus TaxID=1581411 RepID=A0ABT3GK32_9BACT|nr:carboxy terminal-processing peptidase [Luteolibacter arcticus]MCW1923880.1 carboxy terminal-processing peptidase [Luteolibacter arcticus]
MKRSHFLTTALAIGFTITPLTGHAGQADYNEVGKQMAIMLQNGHVARPPFDEMSQRFLDAYLRSLDPDKLYFTQEDVSRFGRDYGGKLANMLLRREGMKAAQDIYGIFRQRVEARVAEADRLLAANAFDFSTEETILRSRKDAAWPPDETAAVAVWQQQVKADVLADALRRSMAAQIPARQAAEKQQGEDMEPKDKIARRYLRLREDVRHAGEEDVAARFLNAVAHSFDPHTDYFTSSEMTRFQEDMRNELAGIGVTFASGEDGATEVTGIVIGGPADKQGTLQPKDRIVAVDPDGTGPREMVDILFMNSGEVSNLVRGPENVSVFLKTRRAGAAQDETSIVDLVRGKFNRKDGQASAAIFDVKPAGSEASRLGVITLPSFYSDFDDGQVRCSVDVERLLERLKVERIDGLLVDLRNNGGGSLAEVLRITGFFSPRGPVVQVKGSVGGIEVKESDRRVPIYDGPVVVLTNKGSASASEILAGALQDANRAVIVGDTSTFGKGTVQNGPHDIGRMLPFFGDRDNAGGLKITFQKFYRPSGSSTQMVGVVPDIILPSPGDAAEYGEAFLEHALGHDRIGRAPEFAPLKKEALSLPRLKELSAGRVAASKDFNEIIEDVAKAKAIAGANRVSLHLATRQKELDEVAVWQQRRNAERQARFAAMQQRDREQLTFYKLTLDQVAKGGDPLKYDPSLASEDYLRTAKDETAALSDTLSWPSALDPQKRETLAILGDMVDINRNARLAGMPSR